MHKSLFIMVSIKKYFEIYSLDKNDIIDKPYNRINQMNG